MAKEKRYDVVRKNSHMSAELSGENSRPSCNMAQQDPKVQSMQYKSVMFLPKLRKNRKIELRWGNKYYEAIKSAVFTSQYRPYMPADPPQSIKEEIDKTGYVCKQCRDWFLSSIEEHTARRSWVLGFWCQQCFVTTCTHKAQGKSNCSSCIDVETAKHDYLLSKGIKKNLKKGVTRVFYNQCQFFAHLRMHGINVVDLSELMLMPLPCGIEQQHYAQLDKVWKAVMEVMFIRRTHIMDWMRDKKISWDAILNSNVKQCDLIADIVSRYSEDCIGAIDKTEGSRQDNPIQFEDSRRIARRIVSHGNPTLGNSKPRLAGGSARRNTVHVISKLRKPEAKFVPNDIAFVDCGPTPNNCNPESPDMSSPDRSIEFSERGSTASGKESPATGKDSAERDIPLWHSFSQQYDKLRDKSRDGSLKTVDNRTETSSLPSISRTGPRVLTIRSPRSLSLSTIMKHLPNDGINRKKLVVVAEDSKAGNGFSGPSEGLGVKRIRSAPLDSALTDGGALLVPIVPKNDVKTKPSAKPKVPPSTNLLINHKNKPSAAPNAVSQSFSEQMSLHGKIVFQNGRKYIIRHVPKEKYQSIVKDSLVAKKLRNPAAPSVPVSVAKRLLLPKPPTVPVTLSAPVQKSIIITQQPKLTTLLPKIATSPGFSLVPLKTNVPTLNSKSRITKLHKSLIVRTRESMQSELQKTSKKKLDAYVENLKEINDAYSKAMGFEKDSVISSNLKAIQRLEKLAIDASLAKTVKEEPDEQTEDAFEKSARDWELNSQNSEKRNCETCDKTTKPAAYIVGLSGPASDESQFCQCYNNICYLCNTNQGSLLQLKAHIKWHKGKKPFMCPDCSLVFKSAKDLEVHVWTTCFHPMARHIFGCGVCEIEGILDMEAVAKHFLLLHTRRKTICSECKMEYSEHAPSLEDYTQHFAKHHQDIENISEPKRLFLCNLKQCVVRPDLFRAHLSDHIGVLRWIYYKCPFCLMVTQRTGRNKTMIREHLIEHHLDRLHEVVSAESLPEILKGIQYPPTSSAPTLQTVAPSIDKVSRVSNANAGGPMIINARTITPESFEHGPEGPQLEDSTLPKILEVRSEVNDEFETSDSADNDSSMQIVAVESMAESLDTKSEVSDAVSQESTSDELASLSEDNSAAASKVYSSPSKDDVEDDSSTSNDDTSMELSLSPPKLERKPSSLLETNDESQEWDTSETEKSERRPWRIALNSPTSLETAPVAYNCHLCGELINTSWSVIKNHFSSRHAGDYELSAVSTQIPQISSGYIEGGYRDDCSIRKRKTEGQVTPASKRRRRWGPKKYFERPGSPSLGLCVKPEPVQEVEGRFRCKKCEEPFDEISKMREHIATKHRIKGQYLICLECGENFVVVPSLQMHLKALHGIQDPITYLTKNTAYAPDTPEDTDEEERATESNQCYVCMAVFEDKAAVDKHIRVHGMAFLKRKRFEAQKAQKCWEKKGEPPDNTGSATSPDNKSKDAEEGSKPSLKSIETPDNDSKAGSSEDGTKNVQKPLTLRVKNFDLPDSSYNSANTDDKSHNVQDSVTVKQENAAGEPDTSETA